MLKAKLKQITDSILKNITLYMVIFLVTYAALPILSPLMFKIGLNPIGHGIQFIYRVFCHQRVERSAYLFGEGSLVQFYSVDELKEIGAIPNINPYTSMTEWADEFFAYPFWGNDEIGYKMAYCIRDFGLYSALAIASVILYVYMEKKKKIVKFPWQFIVLMLAPMILDGFFQMYVEYVGFPGVSEALQIAYISNIPKRIITGALFGVGFSFLIIPALKESAEYVL